MAPEGTLTFTMQEREGPKKVRIKVVGAGGAGGNAVNRMIASGVSGVEFIAVNTDYQDLEKSKAAIKIPIGQKLTRGLGTGGNPDRGEQAAIEDVSALAEHLQGADLIFIAAGMGKGTGTGSAPVIARLASEAGALTIAVVTRPFAWEGKQREANAKRGLEQLSDAAATLIVIPNENLRAHLPEDVTMVDAFRNADDILRQGVQGISDLITRPGEINLDFEDARTVLSSGGRAVMGMGMASGKDRALQAAEKAAHNPLLEDASIQGARAILVNFTASSNLTLKEIHEACEFVRQKAHPDVNVLFGTSLDDALGDELKITVVAASFDAQESRVLKRPVFSTLAGGLGATGSGVFGNVPGVDPVPGVQQAASSVYRPSQKLKDGAPAAQEVPMSTPTGAAEKNYEVYQTPTYSRTRRD